MSEATFALAKYVYSQYLHTIDHCISEMNNVGTQNVWQLRQIYTRPTS